ncbi:zinc finger protein 26 [Zerene cesonia]|uniref:zinc finger protein 26 n=1 Tax=Zerene cesonia TaxID=33412 RepID=UPI0018E4DD8E|nr:zinc finger protein 26 [Zerene cesonia]
MDQRVQCPVCTLYLHSGMSLESHLDTHPKDQVIKALCSLSAKNVGSRTPTPSTSERSFRSRTPATDDSVRWSSSRRSAESGYWRRTPSRNKSSSSSNISRNVTPDIRIGGINFDNNGVSSCGEFSECAVKSTKSAPVYSNNMEPPQPDFNPQFPFYPDSQDDPEIKYSRSSDYNIVDNSNPLFAYNLPVMGPTMKIPPTMLTPHTKRANNIVKLLPKQNNMLVKNLGGLRYITPNVKPYPVMMSAAPSFMQKNVQTNMMMSGNIPVPDMLDPKAGGSLSNQLNQMSADSLSSGTTVVTQNSQIIYREMVHNMDGKPYITNMPHMLSTQENMAQSSSMYQNVMVVDQFGNTSCMYNTPPPLIPKPCNPPIFSNNLAHLPNAIDKSIPNIVNDVNKTLIIEVSPMLSTNEVEIPKTSADTLSLPSESNSQKAVEIETSDLKTSTPGSCKGLKILSNIKVEVPVQHHKNMINTVMDLTGPGDSGYIQRPSSPEKILPDLDEKHSNITDDCNQPSNSSGENVVPHSFSVIKNVGNPQTSKDFSVKQNAVKIDIEFSDSCPVPDLICNEKPSISPCSELLDHGENSMDRCSPITKSEPSPKSEHCSKDEPETDYNVPAKRKASINIDSFSPKTESISKQEHTMKNGIQSPKPQPSAVPSELVFLKFLPCGALIFFLVLPCVLQMYPEVTPAEPYDLIARESWVSDGSDIDTSEKRDNLEEDALFTKTRLHTCSQCGLKFPTLKELRSHCNASYSHSRVVTSRAIKKEEKPDEGVLAGNLLYDSKESVATTMLQAYDTLAESKPELRALIKREKKKKRNFVCPTCKVDQGNDVDFNNHLKIHPLECHTCGKCFFRRANLALHIKTHLGIKNYKCEICQKRFITRQKLNEHRNVHTGHAPVKCTVCDDTFRRYSNMVQHRDRHHLNKKAKVRDYICQCGAVFHSRAKLHWHRETHDERPKACAYCSDKFVHAASLTRHVRRTHNEYYLSDKLKGKVDNVTCPVCKQVYLRTNLRAHLLTHSGKRPYHCIICNKAFTTKWNLKLHRWTHMSRSAKPYKCNLCKGAFVRHTEYVAHMNAHKSVRPYTCNYCGCQFIRKYNCQRHVREHEMAKKYVCKVPECGKSFHRSYYLSEHMKVHSGVRPFACNICGKTSSNKSNHNKHVKIHHAREPIATEA